MPEFAAFFSASPSTALKYESKRSALPRAWSAQDTPTSQRDSRDSIGCVILTKGAVPAIITAATLRAVSFTLYNNGKSMLAPITPHSHSGSLSSLSITSALSGGATGAFMAFFSAPFEFIKVQRQLSVLNSAQLPKTTINDGMSSLAIIQQVRMNSGILGLYRGFASQLLRDSIGTAFYFSVYESFKHTTTPISGVTPAWAHMLGGGIAGTGVWLVLFPIDLYFSCNIDAKACYREML